MSHIQMTEVRTEVKKRFSEAKKAIEEMKKGFVFESAAVSDRIPGYNANKMNFGAYQQDNFSTLFIDMRQSTLRAQRLGPELTFLTIHAVLPALIFVIEKYEGTIIDLPGDGAMALFRDANILRWSNREDKVTKESLAVLTGIDLLKAIDEVVNPILQDEQIPPTTFGVGIDTGSVIVTKTGTDNTFDTKAIGASINNASKLSNGENEIKISTTVYREIPVLQSRFTQEIANTSIYKMKYS